MVKTSVILTASIARFHILPGLEKITTDDLSTHLICRKSGCGKWQKNTCLKKNAPRSKPWVASTNSWRPSRSVSKNKRPPPRGQQMGWNCWHISVRCLRYNPEGIRIGQDGSRHQRGSMDPHIRVVKELFSAARTEFKHMEHSTFTTASTKVFGKTHSRRWNEQIPTHEVLRTYGPDYKCILSATHP
ncbi:hypothetical protein GQR58_030000 [Nymphon striatum]|nr:hypothetical protein GQR58_030000 [Nymphon striatum]